MVLFNGDKDQEISLFRDCLVDYFITRPDFRGYNGMNL